MNKSELNIEQLSVVSGARWADILDHNYGMFMQTKRFNTRAIVHPEFKKLNMNGSLSRGGIFKAIEK
ncbi:hypothetical protein [Prochlorococcus marinus]|uniref:hypothetical protein n=1 Tax=Prochlorococcus marinus TaxID=1219 RepID=UPI0022B4DF99|nr:hypothetical protein [Prochlorococcus marinus]